MLKLILITLVLTSVSFCILDDHIVQLKKMNAQMRQLNSNIRKMSETKGRRRLMAGDVMAQPLQIGAEVNSMVRRLSKNLRRNQWLASIKSGISKAADFVKKSASKVFNATVKKVTGSIKVHWSKLKAKIGKDWKKVLPMLKLGGAKAAAWFKGVEAKLKLKGKDFEAWKAKMQAKLKSGLKLTGKKATLWIKGVQATVKAGITKLATKSKKAHAILKLKVKMGWNKVNKHIGGYWKQAQAELKKGGASAAKWFAGVSAKLKLNKSQATVWWNKMQSSLKKVGKNKRHHSSGTSGKWLWYFFLL